MASNSQIAGICGALYNWYAVNTGNLCPVGWHVPTESDFIELTDFLEDESTAGGKLKESGTKNWNLPNTGATNISGYTAIPAGFREFDGAFVGIGNGTAFWTTKDVSEDTGSILLLVFNSAAFGHESHDKNAGLSVRCIKD